ncbi:MAG: hypothetical protein VZQ98_07390 [Bacteroidales bacterium]|nr:hypothetical protein [Bacteroidales bacterium]
MKKNWKYLAYFSAIVLGCSMAACTEEKEELNTMDINGAIHLNGYITKDSVLKDLGLDVDYIIDDQVTVENQAKLTIEAGVTIAFAQKGGYLQCSDNGAISMEGTKEKGIVFHGPTLNSPNGSWGYIGYFTDRPENKMSYVSLLHGGSEKEQGVLRIESEGSVSVKNCLIDGSLGNGVYNVFADNALTAFENNTITNVEKSPLLLQSFKFLKNIADNNSYTNNKINCITFDFYANSIDEKIIFNDLGYDYLFNEDFTIEGDGRMIVNENVTMKFGNGKGIWIPSGLIQINGTEEKPVTLTGYKNEAGYWRGIIFESDTQNQGGSYMKNCIISNAADKEGEDNSALYIHTAYTDGVKMISLENVKFQDIQNYALTVLWDRDRNEVEGLKMPANVTFENCGHNVMVDLNYALNMTDPYFFDSLDAIEIPEEE